MSQTIDLGKVVPQKGTDYWTPADQAEVNNAVADAKSAATQANTAAEKAATAATAAETATALEHDRVTAGLADLATYKEKADTAATNANTSATNANDAATAATAAAAVAAKATKEMEETATADHVQAQTDHSTANNDHTTATLDHSQAVADHTQHVSDHSEAASQRAQEAADWEKQMTQQATDWQSQMTQEADDWQTQYTTQKETFDADHATAVHDHEVAPGVNVDKLANIIAPYSIEYTEAGTIDLSDAEKYPVTEDKGVVLMDGSTKYGKVDTVSGAKMYDGIELQRGDIVRIFPGEKRTNAYWTIAQKIVTDGVTQYVKVMQLPASAQLPEDDWATYFCLDLNDATEGQKAQYVLTFMGEAGTDYGTTVKVYRSGAFASLATIVRQEVMEIKTGYVRKNSTAEGVTTPYADDLSANSELSVSAGLPPIAMIDGEVVGGRTVAGGDERVTASGNARYSEIKAASGVWHQLIKNANFASGDASMISNWGYSGSIVSSRDSEGNLVLDKGGNYMCQDYCGTTPSRSNRYVVVVRCKHIGDTLPTSMLWDWSIYAGKTVTACNEWQTIGYLSGIRYIGELRLIPPTVDGEQNVYKYAEVYNLETLFPDTYSTITTYAAARAAILAKFGVDIETTCLPYCDDTFCGSPMTGVAAYDGESESLDQRAVIEGIEGLYQGGIGYDYSAFAVGTAGTKNVWVREYESTEGTETFNGHTEADIIAADETGITAKCYTAHVSSLDAVPFNLTDGDGNKYRDYVQLSDSDFIYWLAEVAERHFSANKTWPYNTEVGLEGAPVSDDPFERDDDGEIVRPKYTGAMLTAYYGESRGQQLDYMHSMKGSAFEGKTPMAVADYMTDFAMYLAYMHYPDIKDVCEEYPALKAVLIEHPSYCEFLAEDNAIVHSLVETGKTRILNGNGKYVDTGYYANNNTQVNVDFGFSKLQNNQSPLGSSNVGNSYSDASHYGILSYASGKYWCGMFVGYSAQATPKIETAHMYNIVASKAKLLIDGTQYGGSMTGVDSTYPMYLFAINNKGNAEWNAAGVYIKQVEFTENGTTKQHWIPTERDGVCGMLDLVSGTFKSDTAFTIELTDN